MSENIVSLILVNTTFIDVLVFFYFFLCDKLID